jgi:trehalose/maltose hydrolase-like predicted phosphorylase
MCAEVGHLQLAHDLAFEAALIDLRDLHHNTRDGLHIASLAGSWIALVQGFGGLRDDEGVLALDPQLPDGISRLTFRLRWRGARLTVAVDHREATYTLRDGDDASLAIRHAGEDVTVRTGEPLVRPLAKRVPLLPPPQQPPGRAPASRRV